MDVIPGDDIIEACGDRCPNGKDESPVKGFPQQPQDFLTLLTGWQEGCAVSTAVPHPWVWVLRLLVTHNIQLKFNEIKLLQSSEVNKIIKCEGTLINPFIVSKWKKRL